MREAERLAVIYNKGLTRIWADYIIVKLLLIQVPSSRKRLWLLLRLSCKCLGGNRAWKERNSFLEVMQPSGPSQDQELGIKSPGPTILFSHVVRHTYKYQPYYTPASTKCCMEVNT